VIGDVPPPERRRLALALGAGVIAAGGLLTLVLTLGSLAYHHRRYTLHDGRLKRLVEKHPTASEVAQGILAEPGNRALAAPASEGDLRAWAARWPPARGEEVLAKRRRWPDIRLFEAGGLVYVLYFDAGERLQDYTLLGP
jgi:hypothetical protein